MGKISFLMLFATIFSISPNVCNATALPPGIGTLLQMSNLPEDALGAVVLRLSDGKTVISHGADKALQPASTMKVLTAIVGLDRLGPAYRARTELRSAAQIEKGVLKGDLILRGLGSTDFLWEDFERMLLSLRHRGVTTIQGNLIVDRTFFQPDRLDLGVPPFDESPEFRYNVIPDALLLNMSLAQYDIETDSERVQIRLTPALDGVSVISNMTFADRPCEKWEDGWKIPTTVKAENGEIRVYLNGTFPKNCSQTLNINVVDRADYVDRLFRATWRRLGGSFTGEVIEAKVAETPRYSDTSLKLLAEHRARPLAEVARNINKSSDNTYTRVVMLTLGALSSPATNATTTATVADADKNLTSLQKGEAEIRAWMRAKGIDDNGLVLENGSGLSRLERIKPAQLASVLLAAYRSKWAPEFMSSLPIAGVDGSMRNRMKDSPAAENARIKTGSLRDVVSIAGYVTDANGNVNVVVAMINHPKAISAGGRRILDALLDWVAKSNVGANTGTTTAAK